MHELSDRIARAAEDAVAVYGYLRGEPPDYSDASLETVDEMLSAAADWNEESTTDQIQNLVQSFGCYVLEVGRRQFGGPYCWFEGRGKPCCSSGSQASGSPC